MNIKIQICRNAEGSKLAFAEVVGERVGFRIAGPKAWGGSVVLESIEISEENMVDFLIGYAPEIIKKASRKLQKELP